MLSCNIVHTTIQDIFIFIFTVYILYLFWLTRQIYYLFKCLVIFKILSTCFIYERKKCLNLMSSQYLLSLFCEPTFCISKSFFSVSQDKIYSQIFEYFYCIFYQIHTKILSKYVKIPLNKISIKFNGFFTPFLFQIKYEFNNLQKLFMHDYHSMLISSICMKPQLKKYIQF
ncbi:hypothetical protein ABPG74_019387 [Tetrahymena malaccensis]